MAKQDPRRSPHSEQGSSSPASRDRREARARRSEPDSNTRPHNRSSGTQVNHRSRTRDNSTSSIISENRFREIDEVTVAKEYRHQETRGSEVHVTFHNHPQHRGDSHELEARIRRIEQKFDVIWDIAGGVETENAHQWSTEFVVLSSLIVVMASVYMIRRT